MAKAFLYSFLVLFLLSSCNNNPQSDSASEMPDTSWAIMPVIKQDQVNPVMGPGSGIFFCPIRQENVKWEEKDVFNPATVVRDGKVYLLYRAEDLVGKYAGTSRIGLAESSDGLHFTRHPEPVLYPDNDDQMEYEWEGGCEDPRVVEDENGRYYMTYSSYDGNIARLMIASSADLKKWTKHGPVFRNAYDGKYKDKWSKSGSIVSIYRDGKIVATRINGRYWMYWGDVNIWAAHSTDLINWIPVLYEKGEKPAIELRRNAGEIAEVKIVFGPRKGYFDSDLVEPGPPAMITDKGIVLIYNSRNIPAIGDTSLQEGTYAAGQALMDKTDPMKMIGRTESYFIKPDKPYEMLGQVNQVCFVEGLAEFQNKWFMYYGTADSKIAVAVGERR